MNDIHDTTTHFLRERRALQVIRDLVAIPNAAAGRKTIAWSVGCSTGDEPYGLAMLCREVYCELDILATDINPAALEHAQRGMYDPRSLRHIRPELRERWFERTGDTWQIEQLLRERVRFRMHDITQECAPRHDVDVVLCRNVLADLEAEQAKRAVTTICDSLRPGGLLLLGDSEWMHRDLRARGTTRLVPIEKSGIIVYQRIDSAPVVASTFEDAGAPMSNACHMVEQLRWLGDKRLDADQPLDAAACYGKALELAPLLADLHLRLALSHLHAGEPRLACESLQRALFVPPHLWSAWTLLVDVACEPAQSQHDLRQARSLIEAASASEPPVVRALSSERAALPAARLRRRVLN